VTALLDRLRKLAEVVPVGGAVIVPRDWLDSELQALMSELGSGDDLTVGQVAASLNRPESTIRDWLYSGRLTGAYKRGKVWRVPRTAVDKGRLGRAPHDEPARLNAWRRVHRSRT
jgi:excisionase family DNA binding protein